MKFLASSSEKDRGNHTSSVQKVIDKMKNKKPIIELQDIRIVESLKEKINDTLVNFHPKMRIEDVEEIKSLTRTQISNYISDSPENIVQDPDDDLYASSNDSMDNRFDQLSDGYPSWDNEEWDEIHQEWEERQQEWEERQHEWEEEAGEDDEEERINDDYCEFAVHEFM